MKTPRDILFTRHQAAQPKLDAIRDKQISLINHKDTKSQSWVLSLASLCRSGSSKLWQELVLPSRRTWAGLATVWALLAAINLAQRETAPVGKDISIPMRMSFVEQQRLMNELFADRSLPMDADRVRTFSPKPRTETFQTIAT